MIYRKSGAVLQAYPCFCDVRDSTDCNNNTFSTLETDELNTGSA